jgi:hypothetical protein
MTFPRARLVVSACLFVAWLFFLLYLVIQNQHMIVLSRPQFLRATLCVIAELKAKDGGPEPQVEIVKVLWAELPAPPAAGDRIEVKGLAGFGSKQGYAGPGKYILALTAVDVDGSVSYQFVPVPSAPLAAHRIYPLAAETERQLDEIQRRRG